MTFSPETFSEEHETVYKDMDKNLSRLEQNNGSFSIKKLGEDCKGDEDLEMLFDEVLDYSGRYIEDVCDMESLALRKDLDLETYQEEIAIADKARTILHTATMDSIKILIRNLKKANKDVSWAKGLKDDRPQYARLASLICYQRIKSYLENKKQNHG